MKQITLKELSELVKNDEALRQKMVEGSQKFGGGSYLDALKDLAAEQGYELATEELSDDLEMLSDDDLEDVAGGFHFFGNAFCQFMMELFGYNGEEYCD